jgi:DNA-binding GntR family transcriptional regulator
MTMIETRADLFKRYPTDEDIERLDWDLHEDMHPLAGNMSLREVCTKYGMTARFLLSYLVQDEVHEDHREGGDR